MKSSRIESVLESDGSNYQEWKYDIEIYLDEIRKRILKGGKITVRQQKIVGREQLQGKLKLGIQETSEMKNADNALQKTFKSHSLRRGPSTLAGSNAMDS
jgi:hypothetical protein